MKSRKIKAIEAIERFLRFEDVYIDEELTIKLEGDSPLKTYSLYADYYIEDK